MSPAGGHADDIMSVLVAVLWGLGAALYAFGGLMFYLGAVLDGKEDQ